MWQPAAPSTPLSQQECLGIPFRPLACDSNIQQVPGKSWQVGGSLTDVLLPLLPPLYCLVSLLQLEASSQYDASHSQVRRFVEEAHEAHWKLTAEKGFKTLQVGAWANRCAAAALSHMTLPVAVGVYGCGMLLLQAVCSGVCCA